MKKSILVIVGLIISFTGYAQQSADKDKPDSQAQAQNKAQVSDQQQYQQKWLQSTNQYSKDYTVKADKSKKNAYAKMYFDLGKQYYFAKDYPAAMVCFNKVVSAESEADKEYTSMAQKFILQINQRLPEQIEKQYSVKCGKDFPRFRQGVEKILTQHPSSQELAAESGDRLAALSPEVKLLQEEVNATQADTLANKEKMRLQLQKEILKAKQEIEKIIFDEKTRQVQDQLKAQQMLPELKKVYLAKDPAATLAKAQELLQLDPRNPDALKIKQEVEQIVKEQEAKRKRQEEERLRKEAEEKQRVQFLVSTRLKEIKTHLFNQEFQPAAEKLKEIQSLDPENKEAFELRKELKRKVKALNDNL